MGQEPDVLLRDYYIYTLVTGKWGWGVVSEFPYKISALCPCTEFELRLYFDFP